MLYPSFSRLAQRSRLFGLLAISFVSVFGLQILGFSRQAHAQFSFEDLASLETLLGDSISEPFVRTIGMAIDHKPYEPATPLGMNVGLDISIDVTAFTVPEDFKTALRSIGSNAGDQIPVLPMGRLHLHKGIGETVTIGASYLGGIEGYEVIGTDLSVAFFQPDQGLTYAFRATYAYGTISFVKAHVLTPQILASRRMSFADPYIGFGTQLIYGKVEVPLEINSQTITQSASAFTSSLLAFLGVGLRLGPTGIKLTIEGSFSGGGAHSMGTKLGLSF